MNLRENTIAILSNKDFDKVPIVHFGYWYETLQKWEEEGHIPKGIHKNWNDCTPEDIELEKILGFDFNWQPTIANNSSLLPSFEKKVLKTFPDGSSHLLNYDGTVILQRPGAGSIPSEIDHSLKNKESYRELYKPRLQLSKDRLSKDIFTQYEQEKHRDKPIGLHVGSLFGNIRTWLGIENSAYLLIDDEDLYDEIVNDVGNLAYECTKQVLQTGLKFDYAHFWEDISFKNGPLINPAVFASKIGPHYKRITDLVRKNGIDLVSVDSDGMIDALIPTWLENGVHIMFPIEVGTWNACIEPWRAMYGNDICGVGGMNKNVFSGDYSDVDKEVERLKHLVSHGGYIPCPDHRIAPDAKFDNVKYYTDKMRRAFQ